MDPNAPAHSRRKAATLLDLLAVGILGAAAAGFFWRIVFAGEWMPAGGGDLASFLYPSYRFAADTIKSGHIPFWNPYLWGGAPFSADIQSSAFYPPLLAYFFLAPQVTYRGLMAFGVFHFWLAGAGAYLCVKYAFLPRPEPLSPAPTAAAGSTSGTAIDWMATLASLFAGIAFMFSDFFVVHFGNLNLVAQAAWLPFVCLFFHRSILSRSPRGAIWAGVFLAVAATAGHIQPLLFIVLVLVLDLVFQWAAAIWRAVPDRSFSARQLVAPLGVLMVTLLVGLGLASFVLLPSLAMSQYTARVSIDYTQASRFSLAPAQLIGLLVPSFFGRDPAVTWGGWDRVEVGYLGILPLVLAALATMAKRDHQTGFLVTLAAVSLATAMGGFTVLHGWLFQIVPGLAGLRAPARFVFVFDFALAALAATGFYRLLREREDSWCALRRLLTVAPWVVGAVVLVGLPLSYHALFVSQDKDPAIYARAAAATNGTVFFAILLIAILVLLIARFRRRLPNYLWGMAVVLLLFFDLASLGGGIDVGNEDPTRTFSHPSIVQFLKADESAYRIDTRTNIWHLWQPDTSLLNGIGDVAGVVNPLTLVDYQTLLNSLPDRTCPLYDFLNAKYVIGAKDVVLDWDKFAPVFDQDPQLNVYLNRTAMPRATMIYQPIFVPSHQDALDAVTNLTFDPRSTVVIEGGGQPVSTGSTGVAGIGFSTSGPNVVDIVVETPVTGFLVLSEVWYPGWQAHVDGKRVDILRANYAFRAVSLEPGTHHVVMAFRPPLWATGVWASAAVLFLTLAGLIATSQSRHATVW